MDGNKKPVPMINGKPITQEELKQLVDFFVVLAEWDMEDRKKAKELEQQKGTIDF